MPERDLYQLLGGNDGTPETEERWMIGIPGIVVVNEDPEHQDRIKVLIPLVDENRIQDKWVEPFIRFAGKSGYGDSHRPAKGTEVLLFGRGGMKHNLFYVSRYNEDYLVPEELRDPKVRGFKTEEDYKELAGRDIEIDAGRDIEIKAEGDLLIKAGDILTIRARKIVLQSDTVVEIVAPGGLILNGVPVI